MLFTDQPSSVYAGPAVGLQRLIVTRRGISDGTYKAIGYLDRTYEDEVPLYEFHYLAKVAGDDKFVPIAGFSDISRRYRSTRLFPSFAERIISAKRPDRAQYLEGLDLNIDADAWEILAASGGHREGDPIELISLPSYDPTDGGRTSACFLAHGVRHRSEEASSLITGLAPRQQLRLRTDPANPANPRAVQIISGDTQLGFVPDPLLDYIHSVIDGGSYELSVVRANPPETHPHLRLLLRVTGRCNEFVFDRPDWR